MDQDGITIESAKDFQVKAKGDFKAEGMNASMKGSTELKVEGGSTAELSSSGSTSVKGSMVQIN
jgi:hypothetical protein